MLSEYQAEFEAAYAHVERILTEKLYLTITGRPAKSNISIIEKLQRIKSRLSQIQDIAGCRAIVSSLTEQDDVVRAAQEWLPSVVVDDKRESPTHGYRAVHLLVTHNGRCVEVQIRTRIQHFWASISEKLSDTYGQEIKYGFGNVDVLRHLMNLSNVARRFDKIVDVVGKDRAALREVQRFKTRSQNFKALKKNLSLNESRMRNIMYETRAVLVEFGKMEENNVLSS